MNQKQQRTEKWKTEANVKKSTREYKPIIVQYDNNKLFLLVYVPQSFISSVSTEFVKAKLIHAGSLIVYKTIR